jgi:phosphate-selective porin OprO/OprP
VETSYILTGEHKGFTSPTPKRSFDPSHGGWGAWEVAVRAGEFSADRSLYADGLASPANAARIAKEKVAAVNWYLNRLFRLSLNYGATRFGGGNRPEEKVVILRFQINFI